MEDGLLYIGRCPRCEHWMQTKVTFGVLVEDLHADGVTLRWTCGRTEPFRWLRAIQRWKPDPEEDQFVKRLTFVCSCGEPHTGRPESAVFAGCGAVWSQQALGRALDAATIQLELGTPQDALWAEEARALSQRPLDRIRAQANQWRTASGSLTAVLAAATLIGAPQAGHTPTLATILLAVSGFVAVLVGTVLSVLAASAVSGYDHRLLAATVLPSYERKRGGRAIRQIQRSMLTILVGVALLAASGLVALLTP